MLEIVDALEREVGRAIDLVLQVGDFGAWPDAARLDEATQRHGGAGDFPRWLAARKALPRPTIFIPGNHEDFEYLLAADDPELLPGLRLLPWGHVVEVAGLRIGGLGGCYSPRSYAMPSLSGKRRRHYCRSEVRALVGQGALDLLLVHDAPAGRFVDIRPEWPRSWTTHAAGITEILESCRPRICLHGHLHGRFERTYGGVPITGLCAVPWPGCAVVLALDDGGGRPSVLAEWSRGPSRVTPVDEGGSKEVVDVRPLVDALEDWRDAVLEGHALDRDGRKRLHERLSAQPRARRLLMASLGGQQLGPLLDALLDEGWSGAELHRLIDARPDVAELRALLRAP